MAVAEIQKNGVKKTSTTPKSNTTNAPKKESVVKPISTVKREVKESIDDKIDRFEKLNGFTTKRERIVNTLQKLKKFDYSKDLSASFTLVDSSDKSFQTSNTELLEIVVSNLIKIMEIKKSELENQILEFIY